MMSIKKIMLWVKSFFSRNQDKDELEVITVRMKDITEN